MQRTKFFIILIMVLLLIGCSRSATMRSIDSANAVMENNPDTALSILQRIDTATIRSDKERASYAVALTNARWLTSNSSIYTDTTLKSQKPYFDTHGDSREKMIFFYLMGIISRDNEQYSDATIYALEAVDMAEKQNDLKYLGRIHNLLATIYDKSLNYTQALRHSQLSYDYFKQGGYEYLAIWQMWAIGECYSYLGKYTKGKEYFDQVMDYAKINKDNNLRNQVNRSLLRLLWRQKKYREAIETAKKIDGEYDDVDLCLMAWSYYHLDNIDSTEYYTSQMADSRYKTQLLSNISNKRGNLQAAYNSLVEAFEEEVDLSGKILDDNALNIESQYFNTKTELQKQKTKNLRLIFVVVTIVLLTGMLIIFINYRNKLKLRKMRIDEYVLTSQLLEKELDSMKSENLELSKQYDLLDKKHTDTQRENDKIKTEILHTEIRNRIKIVEELCESALELIGNKNEMSKSAAEDKTQNRKFINHISKLIEKYTISDDSRKRLEEIVDWEHDGVMTAFKTEMPALYEKYGLLVLFLCLQMSRMAIAFLLGTDKKNVYNQVQRLKVKLKAQDDSKAARILSAML